MSEPSDSMVIDHLKNALTEERAKVKKLRDALIKFVMAEAPCAVCGYNGRGYYQPGTHACAKIWHSPVNGIDFARKALKETE